MAGPGTERLPACLIIRSVPAWLRLLLFLAAEFMLDICIASNDRTIAQLISHRSMHVFVFLYALHSKVPSSNSPTNC